MGPDDRFCEVDGTDLGATGASTPAPPVGAPVVQVTGPVAGGGVPLPGDAGCACGGHPDPDGFCDGCGHQLAGATQTIALAPGLAAATHVGRAHECDEDALAIGYAGSEGVALVVCDGVSNSAHGELASAAAARAAFAVLRDGGTMADAIAAAHRAVCEAGIEPIEGKDPPGTTFVAAVIDGDRVDVGWVGDSRAYLIAPTGLPSVQLSRDDSWVNHAVDSGEMTEEEAMRSPYAHAILHCLGPVENADPAQPPPLSTSRIVAEPGSLLLLCSDGLWNYVDAAEDLAALVHGTADADTAALATRLVQHALDCGGHDDVSVAVAELPLRSPPVTR